MEPISWTSLDYFHDYYRESEQSILSTLTSIDTVFCLDAVTDDKYLPLANFHDTVRGLW